MIRCRAATAAHDVDETFPRPLSDVFRHHFGAQVIAAELVRQACVRVSGYERVGYSAEFSDVGPQFLRPEGTVKPYGKRPCMAYRVPEGLRRLPGKRAAGEIGNRAGDHDGAGFLPFFKELVDREESRPGVQGIEN